MPLFAAVYVGFFVPIALVQVLGAVAQAAAFSIPSWDEAALVGTPDLLFQMVGAGSAARFVMVLLCFSVIANTGPTIYSCGLSAKVAIPFLVRGKLLVPPLGPQANGQYLDTCLLLSYQPSSFL